MIFTSRIPGFVYSQYKAIPHCPGPNMELAIVGGRAGFGCWASVPLGKPPLVLPRTWPADSEPRQVKGPAPLTIKL